MRALDGRRGPRRRQGAARRRPARGDRGRRRARAGGPARHRRRAEPEHRVERRAQDATAPAGLARPAARVSGAMRERAQSSSIRALRRARRPGRDAPARLLSGGNCRRSCSGASSRATPRVLVAASPTRGLDVGAIETVHAYLREAAAGGVGVLLISEDLDEILALADRIVVMYEGRIVGELDAGVGDGRGDRPADGGRARAAMRIERRLEQPRWLLVVVPVGSLVVRVRADGGRAARDRSRPGLDLPPDLRLRVHRATARSTTTFVSATPLALHRARGRGRVPDAALQHRRRGPALRRARSRGAAVALYLGGAARVDADLDRRDVRRRRGGRRGALGADPGVLRAFLRPTRSSRR